MTGVEANTRTSADEAVRTLADFAVADARPCADQKQIRGYLAVAGISGTGVCGGAHTSCDGSRLTYTGANASTSTSSGAEGGLGALTRTRAGASASSDESTSFPARLSRRARTSSDDRVSSFVAGILTNTRTGPDGGARRIATARASKARPCADDVCGGCF